MKVKYQLFVITCFIFNTVLVSAKENIVYEWKENYSNDQTIYRTKIIEKNDSYYAINVTNNADKTLISTKFNPKTGKKEEYYLSSEELICAYGLTTYNDEVICVTWNSLYILDEKLKTIDKIYLGLPHNLTFGYNTEVVSKTEEKIIFWDYNNYKIIIVNLETTEVTYKSLDEIEWEKNLGNKAEIAKVLYDNLKDKEILFNYQQSEEQYVGIYKKRHMISDIYNIRVFDKDGKKIFDIDNINQPFGYLVLKDKILIVEIESKLQTLLQSSLDEYNNQLNDTFTNNNSLDIYLKVYDYEGNIQKKYNLQTDVISNNFNTIENKTYEINKIIDTKDGFIIIYNYYYFRDTDMAEEMITYSKGLDEANKTYYEENHESTLIAVKYHFAYDIETRTDGNGTIESKKYSKDGEQVRFIITPKKGYTINQIIVTDGNGNKVTFNDETFIMPSDDVLITATFKKDVKNPNTSSFRIIFYIVLIPLILTYILLANKKLLWLK